MNKYLNVFLIAISFSCSQNNNDTGRVMPQYWIPENVDWRNDHLVFETAYFKNDSTLYLISSFQRRIKTDSIEAGIEPGFSVRKVSLPIRREHGQTLVEPTLLLGNYEEKTSKDFVKIVYKKNEIDSVMLNGTSYGPTFAYSSISRNVLESVIREAEQFPHKTRIIEVEE